MEEYCKNCGAQIKKDAKFCQDCGSPIENSETENPIEPDPEDKNFCPNCGSKVSEDGEFCSECGTDLKNPSPAVPEPKKKSFIEENKIPIIIVGAVAIVVLALLLMASMPTESETYDYDFGTQTVDVGGVDFSIPGNFMLDPGSIDYDYENGLSTYSQTYMGGDETITITVMYSPGVYVDASAVNDQSGGIKKTMYGYDGYYNELSDGYMFSFAIDNKLCMVTTSSPYIHDQIDVIG